MSTTLKRLVCGGRVGILVFIFLLMGLMSNSPAYARHHHHHHGRHHRSYSGYRHSGYRHYSSYRSYGHRSYGYRRSYQNIAAAQAKQLELMLKFRAGEEQAFLNAFDTNHNGKIDGDEIGPAEKYLREVRLGKILPLPPVGMTNVSTNKRK